METPSSVRRVTRSQTLAAASSNGNSSSILRKGEDCDNNDVSKSRQRTRKSQDLSAAKTQDRSALIDITNDSPIVGLASGNLMTPVSSVAKQRSSRPKIMMTPGSGEALLRGQVKTLLQKVEEEAVLSKLPLERRTVIHLQSPGGLLAPTPANTPQISNMSHDGNLSSTVVSVTSIPIFEEEQLISQVVDDVFDGKNEESQITRSLLLDFSEKSETSDDAASSDCSSVLTHQGCMEKSSASAEDDNSSVWSIQVNASSHDDEEEEEEVMEEEEKEEEDEDEDEDEDGYDDDGLLDELCRGVSGISVNERGKAVEFAGKHTRFMYDSEDEVIEEVSDESSGGVSPSILRLKGLPTPKGKHLRFPTDDEEGR